MKLIGSISVKWKVYSIVIVSLIGFAAYLGFNVIVNTENAQLLEQVQESSFPILARAKADREKMDRINELYNTSVTIAEMDFVESAKDLTEALYTSMGEARKLAPQDSSQLDSIKQKFEEYSDQVLLISTGMIEETIDFEQLPAMAQAKEKAFNDAISLQDTYIENALNQFKQGIHSANSNSQTLLQSGFILWVINVVILAATAYAIARVILTNINSVSKSLEDIAKGEGDLNQNIAVNSSDEIGRLAVSFNNLLVKLREKTNDLMSMMHNMHQGLFTIMLENDRFVIHPEYSAYIESIFETEDISGQEFSSLLFDKAKIGSNELDQIITAVQSIVKEDEMMFECNSHLLPEEITVQFPDRRNDARDDEEKNEGRIKILEIDWDPIIADGIVDKIMVTVRDVTSLRAAAAEAEAQKEELDIIGQILHVSPAKFDSFLENAESLLEQNHQIITRHPDKDLAAIAELFANMHTIKGNTRTYGFSFITDVVHDAETTYDNLRKNVDYDWSQTQLLAELSQVEKGIQRYASIKADKLTVDFSVSANPNMIPLSIESYQALLKDCESITSTNELDDSTNVKGRIVKLVRDIKRLNTKPLSMMISGVVESLPSIAQQLDKAPPIVKVNDADVAFKNNQSELLNNVFTHLLRNSMDHGIENRDERKVQQKHAQGTISIDLLPKAEFVDIMLSDDGRGLALAKLKEKGLSSGLLNADGNYQAQDIANLLFESGLSTAETLSDISGRGVGMDAVRKFLEKHHASISIKLSGSPSIDDAFVPFIIKLRLPETMFER